MTAGIKYNSNEVINNTQLDEKIYEYCIILKEPMHKIGQLSQKIKECKKEISQLHNKIVFNISFVFKYSILLYVIFNAIALLKRNSKFYSHFGTIVVTYIMALSFALFSYCIFLLLKEFVKPYQRKKYEKMIIQYKEEISALKNQYEKYLKLLPVQYHSYEEIINYMEKYQSIKKEQ